MKPVKLGEEYEYAGFWIRTGASLIDEGILLMITAYPLTKVYGPEYFLPGPDSPFTLVHGWVDFLLSWVFPAVMTLGFWAWRCATPGKIAIRSIIVDAQTGERPSFRRLLLRYAGYFLSLLPLGLGFLWIVWDKRKQGWHDKIAGTVVIREKYRGPIPVSFDEGGQPHPPPLTHAHGGHV